jgi:hypothetical protein
MAPRLWPAKTSRLAWIKERTDDFKEANAKGTVDAWCMNMVRDYFAKYHWSVPDDVEPMPDATYAKPIDAKGLEEKNVILDKKKKVRCHLNHLLIVSS